MYCLKAGSSCPGSQEICANIVGEKQMDELDPYSRSQYQFSVENLPFFCCWLLLFHCSLHCCCRQPGLWSLPVHLGGPETLWLAWRWGMTIFWCLATACSTLNPGLSPLFMHIFHCPMGLHLQNTSSKKIFLVISS